MGCGCGMRCYGHIRRPWWSIAAPLHKFECQRPPGAASSSPSAKSPLMNGGRLWRSITAVTTAVDASRRCSHRRWDCRCCHCRHCYHRSCHRRSRHHHHHRHHLRHRSDSTAAGSSSCGPSARMRLGKSSHYLLPNECSQRWAATCQTTCQTYSHGSQ
jgi:hypothetical protein